jgi:hypothetical protein
MVLLLTADDILKRGLDLVGFDHGRERKIKRVPSVSIEQQAEELNKTINDCNTAKNNDHAEEESGERRTNLVEQRGKEAP